jgi:tRNA (cmo5U34)-methyltransferase
MKSTVEEIRQRFDKDVERFSILETGQSATIDAPLAMELACSVAAGATPRARRLLDIGCGAGNYSLKMLQKIPAMEVTLIDLSRPMLDRAVQRVTAAGAGKVSASQVDIRQFELPAASVDIVLAAAVLHHLRGEDEWRAVFSKIFHGLAPGGSFWIADMIEHTSPVVQTIMKHRYGQYLAELKDEQYRDTVFAYVEREDTPRPLIFQLDLLREVGFRTVEILHKNSLFATFGAIK